VEILEHKELNPVTFRFKICLTSDEMADHFVKALDHLVPQSQVPGFRKGKAPREMVERHIGTSEIWRMAQDRASREAFHEACELRETSAIVEPRFDLTEYDGKGDFEFTVIFNPEPPSPQDLIKRKMKPKEKPMDPEDHFPDGFTSSEESIFGLPVSNFASLDHDHIISGGIPGSGMPGVENIPEFGSGSFNPDNLTPKMPEIPAQKGFQDTAPDNPAGLPVNPQFRPGLPVDVSRALRGHGKNEKIIGDRDKRESKLNSKD
jgi:trigger factor